MCVYLHPKFQVSSIILTSFKQRVVLPPPPTAKGTPKKNTQIRVKMQNFHDLTIVIFARLYL